MRNFWNDFKKPIIALAPMAGITDQPFRLICKKFGAEVLFSEMVSSEAIWYSKTLNSKSKTLNPSTPLRAGKSKIQNPNNKDSFEIKKLEFGNCLGFRNSDLELATKSNLLKTLNIIRFCRLERPFVVQIFGSDPKKMAYAAKYISSGEWYSDYREILNSKLKILNKSKIQNKNVQNSLNIGKFGFDDSLKIKNLKLKIESIPNGIDLNFGCPARDVTKVGAGAALLKNPKLASQIITSVKKTTKLPLSVKTRLGWDNPKDILVFCRTLEQSGADAIAIHARTYKQGFSGKPNWDMVYKVKKLVKIPVILNGGIETLEDYQRVDLNQIDGVMIGRGALGRPWIFDCIKNPSSKLQVISYKLLRDIILEHANLVNQLKGQQGIMEMRKHLAWYFKGVPNSKEIREKLVRVDNLEEIKGILDLRL